MKNKPLPSPPPVKPATREEVFGFLRGLQRSGRTDDKSIDQAAVRDFINKMPLGSLQGVARRIMMDIMKSPTKDLPSDDRSQPERKRKPATKKKTSPKVKSKRAPKKLASNASKRSTAKNKAGRRRTT